MRRAVCIVAKAIFVVAAVWGLIGSTWSDGPLDHPDKRFVVMCPGKWYFVDDVGDDLCYYLLHCEQHQRLAKYRENVVLMDLHTGEAVVGRDVCEWWPEWKEQLPKLMPIERVIVSDGRASREGVAEGI